MTKKISICNAYSVFNIKKVSNSRVAFIVVQDENVKLMPVEHSSTIDRLLDYVPDLMQKLNDMYNKKIKNSNE